MEARTVGVTVDVVSWLVERGVATESGWIGENLASYLSHTTDATERAKARRALAVARRYMRDRENVLYYLLSEAPPSPSSSTSTSSEPESNPVCRLLRYHGLDPGRVGTALSTFFSSRHGRKNCLWLAGPPDSGAVELAEALANCVPTVSYLPRDPTPEDVSECAESMLAMWRDPSSEAMRRGFVRDLLSGLVVRVRNRGGNGFKLVSRLPVVVRADHLPPPDRCLSHFRAKTWCLDLSRTVPRVLNAIAAVDVRHFFRWVTAVGPPVDLHATQLYDVFEPFGRD